MKADSGGASGHDPTVGHIPIIAGSGWVAASGAQHGYAVLGQYLSHEVGI